jgi:hypothetical protein
MYLLTGFGYFLLQELKEVNEEDDSMMIGQ